ncbi:apoptosis-resistant E3 ubiquitin protein ligase 1-like isoform X2 [Clavelina lepadiformis]|uniref:HECT-type E3 ubiquitin transferase n=1 Tax=Clavelina lepadiformis TaxID=159417 RepID=A0ABP0FCJ1_CLALP
MAGLAFVATVCASIVIFHWLRSLSQRVVTNANTRAGGDVVRYFRGDFLDLSKSVVEWLWSEPIEVGRTVSFITRFYYNNGAPFAVSESTNINVEITSPCGMEVVSVVEYIDPKALRDHVGNEIKVTFTVRKSGVHQISIEKNAEPIMKSPFSKIFIPGPLSPAHTILARTTHAALSVITLTEECNHRIMIDARDEYDNKCVSRLNRFDYEEKFKLNVREASDHDVYPPFTWEIKPDHKAQNLLLDLVVYVSGCFKASLTYEGEEIQNGNFDILVLNYSESKEAEGNVGKENLNVWFECRLLSEEDYSNDDSDEPSTSARVSRMHSMGDMFVYPSIKQASSRSKSVGMSHKKLRKVYCYITPKQLIIKEYYFKIFPKRLCTFKVSPATKMLCGDVSEICDLPTIIIDDGFQPRVILSCSRRNVLAATFVGILHHNMGQSQSFEAKVNHFNAQLREHHKLDRGSRKKIELKIDRDDLLHSSFKATKHLSTYDWCQQFIIHFKNENGLDWGGLNREWLFLLCKTIFGRGSEESDGTATESSMFRTMKDDPQALVLPNCASGYKAKYFEFAGKIVGKCLLESAIGGENARQVAGRFARSFLAQMIGLPVTYMYFESDDPDLYMTKVEYVIDNDVTDMELTFSEEVYTAGGALEMTIDLVPHGSKVLVTNSNKHKYLNRVAQYRLSDSIKDEVESFIKGLTSLVPDNLLSVFDENELELVMCGVTKISVDDLKENSTTNGPRFGPTCNWFWAAVTSFSQDELARLLQFTTGCSQLPPDGFKALEPRFKLSIVDYNTGGLPTAHTCFNEICMPHYDSYEDLHRMLRIAITEGATGFGIV